MRKNFWDVAIPARMGAPPRPGRVDIVFSGPLGEPVGSSYLIEKRRRSLYGVMVRGLIVFFVSTLVVGIIAIGTIIPVVSTPSPLVYFYAFLWITGIIFGMGIVPAWYVIRLLRARDLLIPISREGVTFRAEGQHGVFTVPWSSIARLQLARQIGSTIMSDLVAFGHQCEVLAQQSLDGGGAPVAVQGGRKAPRFNPQLEAIPCPLEIRTFS